MRTDEETGVSSDPVEQQEQELVAQRPAGDDKVESAVLGREDVVTGAGEDNERAPSRQDLDALEADASLDAERAKSDAELGEELDSLEADNTGSGEEIPDQRDGSGRVVDELARERMEELTESGKDVGEVGVLPQDPGRDNTSARLQRNNPRNSPLPQGEAEEESVLPDAGRQDEDGGV